MVSNSPKVLVGAPTAAPYKYCLEAYAKGVKGLTHKNYTVVLVDNSKEEGYAKEIAATGLRAIRYPKFLKDSRERLAASRNKLRELALKENYDYFLSLEQDVVPPHDIIEKLLAPQKQIVTGVYCKPFSLSITHQGKEVKKVKKLMPLLCGIIPGATEKMHMYTAEEVEASRVMQVRFSGLGCMLIHRDVLEKIKFRADPAIPCHDDVWFSNDAWNNKIPLFCNTAVKSKHLIKEKPTNLFQDCKKEFKPAKVLKLPSTS